MTVQTGDILQVVIDYVYPGAGTALNRFFYLYNGQSILESDFLDELVSIWTADFGADWANNSPDVATMNNMEVKRVSADGTTEKDLGTRLLGIDGNLPGEVCSAAVSQHIVGYTNVPQVRGSKYVPALAESAVSDGVLTVGALTNLGLMAADYLATHTLTNGGTISPGVVSKRQAGFVPFNTAATFNSIPAYQRRRKPGVGI